MKIWYSHRSKKKISTFKDSIFQQTEKKSNTHELEEVTKRDSRSATYLRGVVLGVKIVNDST